ncbi:unnamed protein product [marine sediment metagenome]|uniref:Uncharacterized protein n=1 Tax=marine sediment metagenome TaxID=412755 RepID=X1PVZ3_9ZZZZ
MEKQVEIEIMGYKAKIGGVRGHLKDGIWRKEDCLDVWFEFDEPVGSTLGFGIDLPVKNYGQQEFLEACRQEGERKLKEILVRDATRREQRRLEEARQSDLDSLAAGIERMIQL